MPAPAFKVTNDLETRKSWVCSRAGWCEETSLGREGLRWAFGFDCKAVREPREGLIWGARSSVLCEGELRPEGRQESAGRPLEEGGVWWDCSCNLCTEARPLSKGRWP